jgi:hypothetical protein
MGGKKGVNHVGFTKRLGIYFRTVEIAILRVNWKPRELMSDSSLAFIFFYISEFEQSRLRCSRRAVSGRQVRDSKWMCQQM